MCASNYWQFFCCALGPSPGRTLFAKRQKGNLERIVKPRAHTSIPAAAAGRPGSDDTATAPVRAGSSQGGKWSPEAKDGHPGCQKGRLDGRAQSQTHRSKTIPRAHMEPLLHFQIAFTGFAIGGNLAQRHQKQSHEAKTWHPGPHMGCVEDCKASSPWQNPSGCSRQEGQRRYNNRTCRSGGLARTKVVP